MGKYFNYRWCVAQCCQLSFLNFKIMLGEQYYAIVKDKSANIRLPPSIIETRYGEKLY